MFLKRFGYVGNCRSFLPYCNVDTVNRFPFFEIALLVYDGVYGNCSFSCLPVADDQLSLSSSYGDHCIDRLDPCLQGLLHGLAENNSRSLSFKWQNEFLTLDRTFTVKRLSGGRDNPSKQTFTNAYRCYSSCTFYNIALVDLFRGSKQHGTNIVFLKVKYNCFDAIFELYKFIGLCIRKSVNTGYPVSYLKYGAHLLKFCTCLDALKLLPENERYFCWFNACHIAIS